MTLIPINQPIVEANFNQRDSYVRHRIDPDRVHYTKNAMANNTPAQSTPNQGGYENYPGNVEGQITRELPSDSFGDHFSQARLFWNSMSPQEKHHIVTTFSFHIGKVKDKSIRQRSVDMFANVDKEMATQIAHFVGVNAPQGTHVNETSSSPAISEANTIYSSATQKVGILIGDGFNGQEVNSTIEALKKNGVFFEVLSDKLGFVVGADATMIEVNKAFMTTSPVLYDALYVVGGHSEDQDKFDQDVMHFVREAYKFYKPIGIANTAQSYIDASENMAGVVFAADSKDFANDFVVAISQQRFWDRGPMLMPPPPESHGSTKRISRQSIRQGQKKFPSIYKSRSEDRTCFLRNPTIPTLQFPGIIYMPPGPNCIPLSHIAPGQPK